MTADDLPEQYRVFALDLAAAVAKKFAEAMEQTAAETSPADPTLEAALADTAARLGITDGLATAEERAGLAIAKLLVRNMAKIKPNPEQTHANAETLPPDR